MEVVGSADTLDGDDVGCVLDARHLGDAGPDYFSVEKDRTGTALTGFAAYLRSGESELLPQHGHESVLGLDENSLGNSVDI
jgi:hypothetical protein